MLKESFLKSAKCLLGIFHPDSVMMEHSVGHVTGLLPVLRLIDGMMMMNKCYTLLN